jgi:NitT/TauT family transport system substrate-binding protein
MRRLFGFVLGVSLLLGFRAEAATKITIGVAPVVPLASTLYAMDKGWLSDAGFDVSIETVDSATKFIASLSTGQIQLLQGGIGAVYFNAIAQGLPITMALDSGQTPVYQDLMVRPDLKDQIKEVKDLKGRSIGFVAPAGVPVYSVGKLLQNVGLTIKDIDDKYMPFPDMATALANKAIDAVLAVPPWGELISDRKLGVRWMDPSTQIGPQPMELVVYTINTDWAKANSEAAHKLMTILARAGREYCQAYHHGSNRQEMAATLVKHKILNDPAMIERMAWQARDPNGRINVDSLVDEEEWFNRFGMLPKAAPREKLADPSYAEAAAKELGPFEIANKDSKLGGCR